ncbi:hypothetical protein GCM10007860_34380 [Chitiniphilus shinanonensis]|uniref:Uncharacterized protein n=1 Tax=Chitiniphilus shinanonensis TaxID=553088 RepID=A0ABQ6C197_9NEIS|nr:hypothetical protein [Chitiniphilus shinanonensis]GLS06262.1 hypothetical protein GCM10007860_34380 [Chitiniphilus shinanonensis]
MPTTLSGAQLAALANVHRTRIVANAGVYDAACWNWALYGIRADGPNPRDLYGFVSDWRSSGFNAQQLAEARDGCWERCRAWPYFAGGSVEQQAQRRGELVAIRDFLDGDRNTRRPQARKRVFDLALRVAGLTVSAAQTPYRIIARADHDNDVIDDHWWIELNATHTVETIPGVPLLLEEEAHVALQEASLRLDNDQRPIDVAIPRFQTAYLQELTNEHIALIAQLLAAADFPNVPGSGTPGLGVFQARDRATPTEGKAALHTAWEENRMPA